MQKPNTSNFFRLLKSDRAVLIICISIALIFWTLTRLSQSYKTTQECKLYYNLPEGYILASDAPEKLEVAMEGIGWDLMANYFSQREGSLSLNLNDNPRQIYNSAQLINKLVRTQGNIDINGLNIDILDLEVEEQLSKKVPITLDANLSFDSRYHLKQAPLLLPDSILLSGPETTINNLTEWLTSTVTLEDINKNTSLDLTLKEPKAKNLSIAPKKVALTIEVEQLTEKNFFVPIKINNAPDSIKIFPNNIKMSCVVGLSHYDQIGPDDFELEVNMAGIAAKEENNSLPVLLSKQPKEVKSVHLSHQSVEFFFVENTVDTIR